MPGAGGTAQSWRPQINPLDRRLNVIALEFPGHGRTPGPPLASVKGLADLTIRAIRKINPPGPLFLAGASLGAAVTLETALQHPDAAEGLILISASARGAGAADWLAGFQADPSAALADFVRRGFGPDADPVLITASEHLLAQVPRETMRADFKAAAGFNRIADLGRIALPTLVICGTEDRLTPPAEARLIAAGLARAELKMIPEAGHLVWLERHQAVNRAVLEFVDPGRVGA